MLRMKRLGTSATVPLVIGCVLLAACNEGAADAEAVSALDGDGGVQREPLSEFEIEPFGDLGLICNLLVGASCDGDEDCPGEQLCCGDYNQDLGAYTRIGCADSCSPQASQYKLCHPGESCPTPGRVCRRSSILPYDFMMICAGAANVPTEYTGGDDVGRIRCGDTDCGSGEQCCLRSEFNLEARISVPRSAYCTPLDAECECGFEATVDPNVDADAGME